MDWKNRDYWFKGGVVGIIITVVFVIVLEFLVSFKIISLGSSEGCGDLVLLIYLLISPAFGFLFGAFIIVLLAAVMLKNVLMNFLTPLE